MQSSQDLPTNRHPLFPTIAEAKAHPEQVYSDHLPVLMMAPLQGDGFAEDLKIISYNTLGPAAPSGLHAENAWETLDETTERYQRIAAGLAKSIIDPVVDVIALQETYPKTIAPLLKKALGEDWEIIEDSKTGMVTCYNKTKYTCEHTNLDERERIHTLTLKDKNNQTFIFHNIWGIYSPFSYEHDEKIGRLLAAAGNLPCIIAGDFNSRLAPMHDSPGNITTGIVPVRMNKTNGAEENVQITDYPDGGFYRDNQGMIDQLVVHTLDLNSGNICRDFRTKDVVKPWPEFRMIMCLDERYKIKKFIDDKTIFEYEAKLQTELENANIRVRVAANSFNEKAIGIRFPVKLKAKYEEIVSRLPQDQGFQFKYVYDERLACACPCLFAPLDKVALLHEAIFAEVVLEQALDLNEQPTSESTSFIPNLSLKNLLIWTSIFVAAAAAALGAAAAFGTVAAAFAIFPPLVMILFAVPVVVGLALMLWPESKQELEESNPDEDNSDCCIPFFSNAKTEEQALLNRNTGASLGFFDGKSTSRDISKATDVADFLIKAEMTVDFQEKLGVILGKHKTLDYSAFGNARTAKTNHDLTKLLLDNMQLCSDIYNKFPELSNPKIVVQKGLDI